jgi:hypothetical protein
MFKFITGFMLAFQVHFSSAITPSEFSRNRLREIETIGNLLYDDMDNMQDVGVKLCTSSTLVDRNIAVDTVNDLIEFRRSSQKSRVVTKRMETLAQIGKDCQRPISSSL